MKPLALLPLAFLLLGLAACGADKDDDCFVDGKYIWCHPPEDAIVHTETERSAMPVEQLTLADLYWESRVAAKQQSAAIDDYNRELQSRARLLQGAPPGQRSAEGERIAAEWKPRLDAAKRRGEALRDEIGRRCPGGANFNPQRQSCGRLR